MFPHTKEESELIKNGYRFIAGIDEAGRGSWAGPVVAAAVVMPVEHYNSENMKILEAKDSKLLSPKIREKLFDVIIEQCVGYSVGIVDNDIIDEINIYQAAKLAMKNAVEDIQNIVPDHLLIDAMKIDLPIKQKSIIKGDMICYSIACASIIAKVTRDRLMREFHEKYPEYQFDLHKGYGTKKHLEALEKHGPCIIHRKTYSPIAKLIKQGL